ncbi:hypothetical protein [Ralstonia phage RP13]|nr:hypothetical protein [Ralstonia phage RP13]
MINHTKFSEWKLTQDLTKSGWLSKWHNKSTNACKEGLLNKLTFDEYLYKAFEAGLTSHTQVHNTGYHLARIGDQGNYTVESCRFITHSENQSERDWSFINKIDYASRANDHNKGRILTPWQKERFTAHSIGETNPKAKLTSEQVIKIFTDERSYDLIAKDYNVGVEAIRRIKLRITWTHLTSNL